MENRKIKILTIDDNLDNLIRLSKTDTFESVQIIEGIKQRSTDDKNRHY